MTFSHPLIHIALFSTLVLSGCASTPTPQTPQETSQQTPEPQEIQESHPDPLQTTEHWLKTGQSTQNLPIHTDSHTQLQSWNSPHVTRLYLSSPNEYQAIITDQNESPDHALLLTITQQENTWTITHIQQTPARHLWPRF